jgi:UDP-4-amino-4-deoxy-L-arabinose formyltransferase/UDP-glucuronic acid dehydrogenase (UDP-4-keto-hexauronic acid decarboxylating)
LYNKDIVLVGGGEQTRCFTYIDDGISALMKIINGESAKLNGKIFNIGNPQNNRSIYELAELAMREYDKIFPGKYTEEIIHKTPKEFYGSGYEDIPVRVPDIKEAERLLDWKPVVCFEEAVSKTLLSFIDDFEGSVRKDP